MSSEFDNYGVRAAEEPDLTRTVGRYFCQRESERLILRDVIEKLDLAPQNKVLDIGCGVGTLLIPLSFMVEEVFGVDHPEMIRRFKQRCQLENVSLIGGNFLEIEDSMFGEKWFDKILIYSVIHCLPNADDYFRMLDRSIQLLAPGGRILIGDIPNEDRKKRFMESAQGREFEKHWNEMRASEPPGKELSGVNSSTSMISINDELVLKTLAYLRKAGLDAHLIPQPPQLPFGQTREDIWASKR